MKVVCIIQARLGSTRLPKKVLKKIEGKTILQHVVERIKEVSNIDEIIIATTKKKTDDLIVDEAKKMKIKYFRGSEDDVLSRYYYAALNEEADTVVRITSDCPLIDSVVTQKIIEYYKVHKDNFDYVSNTIERTYPRGFDTEIFSFKVLKDAFENADKEYQREHVTPYIYENNKYRIYQYKNNMDYSDLRLTLDTDEDFDLIKEIYFELYNKNSSFKLKEILELFNKKPYLKEINKKVNQKKVK